MASTHAAAADEDNTQRLQNSGCSHDPSEPEEEDDTKYVLQARQVYAHERAHLRRLWGRMYKRLTVKYHSCEGITPIIACFFIILF